MTNTSSDLNSSPVELESVPTSQDTKTKTKRTLFYLLVIVLLLMIIGIGIYIIQKMERSVEENAMIVSSVTQTPREEAPTPSTFPSITTTKANKDRYSRGSFSFTYPASWVLLESDSGNEIFTDEILNIFDNSIALESERMYLLIGINATNDGSAGGIFISENDFNEYLQTHDELAIQGERFFISTTNLTILSLTDPTREDGLATMTSVSKYIPNKVTTDQNITYNGYEDVIKNKNNYDYTFIKVSKNRTLPSETTPSAIQNELKSILESITW